MVKISGLQKPISSRASFREKGSPVSIPNTFWFDVEKHGRNYRILVAVPAQPAPAGGYPVICALDGNALFPMLVETARQQTQRPDVTGVSPAVIVGVGYPDVAGFHETRRADDLLPERGLDDLLDLIVGDVLPHIGEVVPLAFGRAALLGHSFGGLAVLHALLARPGLFSAHVAGSPSIWWNDRAVLDLARASGHDATNERLLVTVGGAEQDDSERGDEARRSRVRMAKMIDNARELVACLDTRTDLTCALVEFPDENHVSSLPAMLARAVRFVSEHGRDETL